MIVQRVPVREMFFRRKYLGLKPVWMNGPSEFPFPTYVPNFENPGTSDQTYATNPTDAALTAGTLLSTQKTDEVGTDQKLPTYEVFWGFEFSKRYSSEVNPSSQTFQFPVPEGTLGLMMTNFGTAPRPCPTVCVWLVFPV